MAVVILLGFSGGSDGKESACNTDFNFPHPMDYTVHVILQARILEWVAFPFSRESSNPEIKPRYLTLQADSLSADLQGKPFCHKDGVNSISEFIDISPGSLGFSLCFMQPGISHDVLCI